MKAHLETIDGNEVVTHIPHNVEILRKKLLNCEKTLPYEQIFPRNRTSRFVKVLEAERKLFGDISVPKNGAWWEPRRGAFVGTELSKAEHEMQEIEAAHNTAEVFERHFLESEDKWMRSHLKFLFKEYEEVQPDEVWQRHK